MVFRSLRKVVGLASQVAALAETHQVIIGTIRRVIVLMVGSQNDSVIDIGALTILAGVVSPADACLR